MRYVKNEKHCKTLARTHVLYNTLKIYLIFTSAQCGHHRQPGQHHANMRIPLKRISACRDPLC